MSLSHIIFVYLQQKAPGSINILYTLDIPFPCTVLSFFWSSVVSDIYISKCPSYKSSKISFVFGKSVAENIFLSLVHLFYIALFYCFSHKKIMGCKMPRNIINIT